MNQRTDARTGVSVADRKRSSSKAPANFKAPANSRAAARPSSKATPLNWVGRGAIAMIALTCGWTVYSSLSGPGSESVVASVRVKSVTAQPRAEQASSFAERFEQASFTDRFGPFVAAVPVTPKKKNVYVALLDPTYSLGPQAGTFAPAPPAGFGRRLADQPGHSEPAAARLAETLPLPPVKQQLALSVPMPSSRPSDMRLPQNRSPSEREAAQAVKSAVLAAVAPKPTLMERLFGKMPSAGAMMAYASPDGGVTSDGQSSSPGGAAPYDRSTAVYDISAAMVYLPDGSKLEAHSGLGSRLDDPRFVSERMRGATPPHVYDLTMRESLFHGVQALRLNPVGGEGKIHGRTGLLAHTYMLGPNGDSNGCVSFKDYNRFLQAYRSGTVKRLVVVAKLD